MGKRTPSEVIDQAVEEGRFGVLMAYLAIVVALCGGVTGIVQAILTQQPLWVVGGGILGSWIWPALRYALKIRQENLALRLLEIPLNQTQSAREAAQLLQDFFRESFFRKG